MTEAAHLLLRLLLWQRGEGEELGVPARGGASGQEEHRERGEADAAGDEGSHEARQVLACGPGWG